MNRVKAGEKTMSGRFFRTRNIWISGLFHGWYATVFYHFVMGEDPLGSLLRAAFAVS